MPESPVILLRPSAVASVLFRAQITLGMTQQELGETLGASRRTASRWAAGQSQPSIAQMHRLARMVHEAGDTALAADIATSCGDTLVGLGLAPVPRVEATGSPPAALLPPPRPSPLVVDAVVCAAADEAGLTPSAVRGILRAAFMRAVALGLTAEDVAEALAPPKPAAARKAT